MKQLYLILLYCCSIFVACTNNSGHVNETVNRAEDFSTYEITEISDKPYKRARKYDEAGKLLEEGYIYKGKRHGQWITYFPEDSGERIQKIDHYLDGELDGTSITLKRILSVENQYKYADGQLHGVSYIYNYGAPLEEFNYANGKMHGDYKKYNKRKELLEHGEYKDGQLHGTLRYYSDGKVQLQYEYENGQKIGEAKTRE